MVGVKGLEPPASSSQNWRATNCATPRGQTVVFLTSFIFIPFFGCERRSRTFLSRVKAAHPTDRLSRIMFFLDQVRNTSFWKNFLDISTNFRYFLPVINYAVITEFRLLTQLSRQQYRASFVHRHKCTIQRISFY